MRMNRTQSSNLINSPKKMEEYLEKKREQMVKDLCINSDFKLIRFCQGGINVLDDLLKLYKQE